ncbi:MAG: hypothetical protein ABI193_07755 [Minicystis sp.]
MRVDENGWALGAIAALAVDEAWSLLSPEPEGRVDEARWAHQAEKFFRARLAFAEPKRYPAGTLPLADALFVDIGRLEDTTLTRLLVVTVPLDRAPAVEQAARLGVLAIGGAGFDALLLRARRLWQVQVSGEGDPAAPAALAALLASLFLAPVLPPGGGTIFGVKGARERLAASGWKS